MGKEITRVDWGDGGRIRFDVVPSGEPRDVLAEMQRWPNAVPASAGDSTLPDATLEAAAYVGDGLLETCPDPEGFQAELMKLPQEDIDLLGRVLTTHVKAGDDVVDALIAFERKATIPQVLRMKALIREMPEELRDWIYKEMLN